MVEIDGSYYSGGGQIVRTATALSTLTNTPVKIFNIRAKRDNPGLREQHLQAVKALATLSAAETVGLNIGATELLFIPSQLPPRKVLNIHISTAGSIGLILQALLIAAAKMETLEVNIDGGATWGKWAPPVEYIKTVFLPILSCMGFNIKINVLREGFYPIGGAVVKVHTTKANFKKLELLSRGELRNIRGVSVCSLSLRDKNIAERQRDAAYNTLSSHFNIKPYIDVKYVNTKCPGTGIHLYAIYENTIIGGNALGEVGKRAEEVGTEAAKTLISECNNAGCVDSYLADQILPYLALWCYYGNHESKVYITKLTEHCRSNIYVIEKFLKNVTFTYDEEEKILSVKRIANE
jgi:RNA 3'-terminal phosphate cyclase (ATP)/RNA 3'-terminal phosphate cyclase (GTP)